MSSAAGGANVGVGTSPTITSPSSSRWLGRTAWPETVIRPSRRARWASVRGPGTEHQDEEHANDDRGVGEVEDRPHVEVDEVDHPASRVAEDPVAQVAESPTEHHAEGHDQARILEPVRPDEDDPYDQDRSYEEEPGQPLEEAERSPWVVREPQTEDPLDQIGRPVLQRSEGPLLRDLIQEDDGCGRAEEPQVETGCLHR